MSSTRITELGIFRGLRGWRSRAKGREFIEIDYRDGDSSSCPSRT